MGRAPVPVLVCGLLGVGLGAAMLAVSNRVAGLAWLAVPIAGLGLALIGLWLRDRVRGTGGSAVPPTPGRLPGRWYPYAVVGVGAALAAWALYWVKAH
jgi:hypothetical protein